MTNQATPETPPSGRIAFLDNIRSIVVLLVVLLHAACAYSAIITWWPVQQFPKELPYTIIILFLGLFCMPVLFFLAGYFAPLSLAKRGPMGHIAAKCRRLGIPLVLLGVFYVPFISFIGHRLRETSPKSFLDFWLFQMNTAWKPTFFLMDDIREAVPRADYFSQWHLWFISLLLLFFVLQALVAALIPASKASPGISLETPRPRMFRFLALALAASVLLMTGSNLLMPPWAWFLAGGYLMFQPSRIGLYAVLFCLGQVAQRREWFGNNGSTGKCAIPGPPWLWLTLALALEAVFILSSRALMMAMHTAPFTAALLHGVIHSLGALAWLLALLSMGQRWWNRPHRMWDSLRRSSYDIYLLHLPLVVGLQLLALNLPVGFLAKCVIETALAIVLCWLVSARLVQPHPRIAAGVLAVAFLAACVAF